MQPCLTCLLGRKRGYLRENREDLKIMIMNIGGNSLIGNYLRLVGDLRLEMEQSVLVQIILKFYVARDE